MSVRQGLAGMALLCVCGQASSPAPWRLASSQHFEVYSSAGEGRTRDTLKQFEQLRKFFVEQLRMKDEKPLPVRIVIFGSEKDYEPYKPKAFAARIDSYFATRP